MKDLDIRDISIIDSLPIYNYNKTILNIGCGKGRIDYYLSNVGFKVIATDYKHNVEWIEKSNLTFSISSIFDLNSFPIKKSEVVICSEVLEHLVEYKKALKNLLQLTTIRLIITIPYKKSFYSPEPPPMGHCNFWDDHLNDEFKNINEFKMLCKPYSVSISKIRTKEKDVEMKQWGYLIIVDKRQKYNNI